MRKPLPLVLPLFGIVSLLGPSAAASASAPAPSAQTPAPAPAPAPAPTPAATPTPEAAAAPTAASSELTVQDSASPELVGALTKELGVTPSQAQGGAGALLGLAKTRLKADEFTKVSAAIPGTDALLKAAPAAKGMSGIGAGMGSSMGGALGLASLAGSFKQLNLSPDQAAKMVPVLTNFVQTKGAGEAAKLLGSVLR